jgi:hypothetical protein
MNRPSWGIGLHHSRTQNRQASNNEEKNRHGGEKGFPAKEFNVRKFEEKEPCPLEENPVCRSLGDRREPLIWPNKR